MLGYSDSTRTAASSLQTRGAFIAPNWRWSRCSSGTAPRAGSFMAGAARSGGAGRPTYQASCRQPPGTVDGQIRSTEQGEVIASKFGNPEIGRRNLELLVAATLEASLLPHESVPAQLPHVRIDHAGALRMPRWPHIARWCTRRRASGVFLRIDTDFGDRRVEHRQAGRRPGSCRIRSNGRSRIFGRFRGGSLGASAGCC